MLSPPLPITTTFLTLTSSSSPALAIYEAVISDPWASCGVADRIAELEIVLVAQDFHGLAEEVADEPLHGWERSIEEDVRDLLEGFRQTRAKSLGRGGSWELVVV